MKKGVILGIVGSLSSLLLLLNAASPTFFAGTQAEASAVRSTTMTRVDLEQSASQHVVLTSWHPRAYPYPTGGFAEHNQYFHGNSNSGNKASFKGSNQGNTGNQGFNAGRSQDNSLNSANQLIKRHRHNGFERTNQYYVGNSFVNDITLGSGYNQLNTGNQGVNVGENQDNSTNSGNQLID